MVADLYVDGTIVDLCDDVPDSVALEFSRESSHRCRACGEDLIETTDGLCADSDEYTCPDSDSGDGPHDPDRIPLSWCNSAAVHADESEDAVTVSISVGDPRGAFTFTIRRVPDDLDGPLAGQLVLHTPYDGMSSPHMPLTPLHDGTHVIGSAYRIRLNAAGKSA